MRVVLALVLAALAARVAAQPEPARGIEHYNLDRDRVAIQGFDPVAYFPEGGAAPSPGVRDNQWEHRGVVYRFADSANLERFRVNPRRYEPAYGGWCVRAMAEGRKVPIDARQFRVARGRLFLFAAGHAAEELDAWIKAPANISAADARWKSLAGEDPPDDRLDPDVSRDVSAYNLGRDALAIQGYDPVAYFPEGGGRPVKGKPGIEYRYRGAAYRFASSENLERFRENPARYEPAHGGWCSTAMADGKKVEIDPTSFKVTEGRLFLFYTGLFSDARKAWVKDEASMTARADEHWKGLSREEPRKVPALEPGR